MQLKQGNDFLFRTTQYRPQLLIFRAKQKFTIQDTLFNNPETKTDGSIKTNAGEAIEKVAHTASPKLTPSVNRH
ncbi:hypothetical protein [Teredinibacter turnerae]|uniref:hypothetical protein n=1 Tax=Teredinibacter turnerae TaxID=2426 RepID=UPI00037CF1A7|nr:hypothetical protein [Teredinibacter turnerae]